MDGQKQSDDKPVEAPPATAPETPKAKHSFMDIRRPKSKPAEEAAPTADGTKKPEETGAPQAKPAETSVESKPAQQEAVAAAPAEEADDPAEKLEEPKAKPAKTPKPPKPPKPPRQPGVGLAIFATIVIILGLGALATYAYLKSNNIAPF